MPIKIETSAAGYRKFSIAERSYRALWHAHDHGWDVFEVSAEGVLQPVKFVEDDQFAGAKRLAEKAGLL